MLIRDIPRVTGRVMMVVATGIGYNGGECRGLGCPLTSGNAYLRNAVSLREPAYAPDRPGADCHSQRQQSDPALVAYIRLGC